MECIRRWFKKKRKPDLVIEGEQKKEPEQDLIPEDVKQRRSINLPPKGVLRKSSQQGYSKGGTVEYRRGIEAWKDSRSDIRHWLQPGAQAGNLDAILLLGVCLECGVGGEKEIEMAKSFYELARLKGSAAGHCLLASMPARHPLGLIMSREQRITLAGTCPTPEKSSDSLFPLYEAAQTYRLPDAMYLLGWLAFLGMGVEKSEQEALNQFRQAGTLLNHGPSLRMLGRFELEGIGCEVSAKGALRRLHEATKVGDAEAMILLAQLVEEGESEVFHKKPEKSFSLCKRATESGDPLGSFALGRCYELGIGTHIDDGKAADLYADAAMAGIAKAQFAIATCYQYGVGRMKSEKEAVQWMRQAAQAGLVEAELSLGLMLHRGLNCQSNYEEAVRWFRRAILDGSIDACYELGLCYRDGHGVKSSAYEAFRWIKMSAEAGNPAAIFDCFLLKWHGDESLLKDHVEALGWLSRSADAGYAEALATLGDFFAEPPIDLPTSLQIQQNMESSHRYYEMAARAGLAYAQYQYGMQFFKGMQNEKGARRRCLPEAVYWIEKAAEQGFEEAEKALPFLKGMLEKATNKLSEEDKKHLEKQEM